jgi:parallel beta-helix repeat protein
MIPRRALVLGALTAACGGKSSFSSSSSLSTTEAVFVATNGSDGNPGTEIAPVRTFAHALGLVTPGTTLYIKGGIYSEGMEGSIPSGRSWEAPVRVAAYQGQAVVLRPVGGSRVLHFEGQSYIVVDGLILDGARVAVDGIKITTGAHHIRIENTEVMSAPNQGILLTQGANSNQFINLRVHDNGRSEFGHGIYVSTDDNLIENCEIYRNAGFGVHAYEAPNRVTVTGCRIYQNVRGAGIGLYGGEGLRAVGNDVSANGLGITVNYNARGAEVVGNRIYNNRGPGILVGGDARGTRVSGNAVFGNSDGDLVDDGEGTHFGANQVG